MSLITLSQLEASCIKGQGYADDIGEAAATAINAVLETASQAYSLAESAAKTATDYLSYSDDTGLIIGCDGIDHQISIEDSGISINGYVDTIDVTLILVYTTDDDEIYVLTDGTSYGKASSTTSDPSNTYSYWAAYNSKYYFARSLSYSSLDSLISGTIASSSEVATNTCETSSFSFAVSVNDTDVLTVNTSGVVTATEFVGNLTGTADYASALEVSAAIGSATKFIYINSSGVPKASTTTVGGTAKPVYLKSGTITVCTDVAAATADALTTTSVGDSSTPIYIDSSGVPQECNLDEYISNIVYACTTTYYVYYNKVYYYCDYSSFSYSSLDAVASYYGSTYVSHTTLGTKTMTVGSESVTVSLLLVTLIEEGEDDEFTINVLTNGTGYSIEISTSSTAP